MNNLRIENRCPKSIVFPRRSYAFQRENQEPHGKPYTKSKFKHTDNYNSIYFQKTVRHQVTARRLYMYGGSGFAPPPPPGRDPISGSPPGCFPIWGFSTGGALGLPQLILSQQGPKKPKKDPKIVKKCQGCSRQPPKWSQYARKKTQKSPKIDPRFSPLSLQQNMFFPMEKP